MIVRIPEKQSMTDSESVRVFNSFSNKYLKKYGYNAVVNALHKNNIGKGRIIDLGSGGSQLSIEIMKSGESYNITCLDLSKEMINAAMVNINGIDFIVGDVHNIPFANNSFDAAVSFASLHHWEGNPASVLKEAYRVVKDGGSVIIYDLKRSKKLLNFTKMIPSKKMQQLFHDSIYAAYTVEEMKEFLLYNFFSQNWRIYETAMTIGVVGRVEK